MDGVLSSQFTPALCCSGLQKYRVNDDGAVVPLPQGPVEKLIVRGYTDAFNIGG